MEKILVSWSGGKDSAFALYEILRTKRYDVSALLTTVTESYGRTSMHGVRQELAEKQAAAIGLPLEKVFICANSSNEEYENRMREVLERQKVQGVSSVAFGDIFLEDLRKYREEKLGQVKMRGIFPLWRRDTVELAREFISSAFKAVITCIDTTYLDKSFAGREYDELFLKDLPENVDQCGEKGEFHSFVYDGPIFNSSLSCKKGEVVLRDNHFYYCDLLP